MRNNFLYTIIIIIILTGICSCRSKNKTSNLSDKNNKVAFISKGKLVLYDQNSQEYTDIVSLNDTISRVSDIQFIDDTTIVIAVPTGHVQYHSDSTEYVSRFTGQILTEPKNHYDSLILDGYYDLENKYNEFKIAIIKYYAVNINSGQIRLYRLVKHRIYKGFCDSPIMTYAWQYDANGKIIQTFDTTVTRIPTRCDDEWRFYYESNLVNKTRVVSKEGSLYLQTEGKEKLILKNDKEFSMKFGNGYCDPTLSPDGNKVVFRKLTGQEIYRPYISVPKDDGIYELDLRSKKQRHLIDRNAINPNYSPGGDYILFKREISDDANETLLDEIVILNLKTNELTKIGEGYLYCWNTIKPLDNKPSLSW